ncbi:toll/interleukin-1 receptor domain-containing protein [Bdellovibrio sp. GT3]|uniref:toll/interleukin-1 receptor domain-containing protein n=1 Tax=Bdellovibrio sp. GT3 TaxID=3136282 RepID=UPI0030F1F0D4
MALYKKSELKAKALNKSLTKSMAEDRFVRGLITLNESSNFDVFLSHRYLDADEIAILADELRGEGLSVYIDWQVDKGLDRGKVTIKTAEILRKRMKQSKSLIFITSQNSSDSKWMPWELGFMDARTSRVAILPVVDDNSTSYQGQEYLGLYPYISKTGTTILVNDPQTGAQKTIRHWLMP